jgi:ABC-type multidrug transport system fused ATPase/permease subunit
MEFLIKHRFSYIDLLCMSIISSLLGAGYYLLSALILLIAVPIVVLIEHYFGEEAKKKELDKQWQNHVHAQRLVEALRTHRTIYGSSLKEAHDIVRKYQSRMGK